MAAPPQSRQALPASAQGHLHASLSHLPTLPSVHRCRHSSRGSGARPPPPALQLPRAGSLRIHRRVFLPPCLHPMAPGRLRCLGTPTEAPLTPGAAPASHGPTKWGKNPSASAARGCSIPRMCYHPGSVSLVRRPRRSSLSPLFLLARVFLSIGII